MSVRRSFFILACFLPLLALDFFSKSFIFTHFYASTFYDAYPYGGVGVFHNFFGIDFSINLVTNRGAAWGVLSSQQFYLQYFRIALILGLLIYLFFFNRNRKKDVPLTMIAAGAIGNVIDYFLYDKVIDMFHFCLWGYHFPTFNVADSAIFCGVLFLALQALFERRRKVEA